MGSLFGHLCGRGESSGFTLIELMVVIAILGTLSSLAIPAYSSYRNKTKERMAIVDIRTLEKDILVFQAANETLPDSLNDIGRGTLLDPWGNPYQYVNVTTTQGLGKCRKDRFMNPLNSDFDLYSLGEDGKSASALTAAISRDDILRASNGEFIGKASEF